MNKLEFLEIMNVKQMVHPTTKHVHFVKDNKSLAMQKFDGSKTIEDIIDDAVKTMVIRITKGIETMPVGMVESDLDDLINQTEETHITGVSSVDYECV